MKSLLQHVSTLGAVAALAVGLATGAQAETFYVKGKVISSTPIYERVAHRIPREVCRYEQVHYHGRPKVQQHNSAAGAVVGGLVGASVGHHVGKHNGNRHAGSIIGGVIGAAVGSELAGHRHVYHGKGETRHERHCYTEYDMEYKNELVGYSVLYKYHGRQYETQLDEKPGRFVRLMVEVSLLDD